MIDEHDARARGGRRGARLGRGRRRGRRLRVGRLGFGVLGLVFRLVRFRFGLAAAPGRPHRDLAAPARQRRELLELAGADDARLVELRAALRHARHHVDAERLAQPRELRERRGVLLVGDAGQLYAERDGALSFFRRHGFSR